MSSEVKRAWRPRPCPICAKLALVEYHPFCSKRCADVDLNRWLAGNYVIPGRDGDRSASSRAEDPSEPDQG